MVYVVTLKQNWLGHVMPNKLKVRIRQEVMDISFGSSEEIIDGYNLMALREQHIAQM
jgi:hypothetical protein